MKTFKKLEIILPQSRLHHFLDILENYNLEGYSVIGNIMGKGERGFQDGLGLSGAFSNAMVISITTEESVNRIKDDILKYLEKHGGIVTIHDVNVLK